MIKIDDSTVTEFMKRYTNLGALTTTLDLLRLAGEANERLPEWMMNQVIDGMDPEFVNGFLFALGIIDAQLKADEVNELKDIWNK